MDHGQGAEVWDVDGNRYVDFAAGIAVLSTGHRHPRIIEAIQKQTERFIHIGGTDFFYREQVELAERLQEIIPIQGAQSPSDKMVYFGNSGTESVEAALKLALYDGVRSYIIGFYGGFHGRSMGALSVTASKAYQRANYSFIPGVEHVPFPSRYECMENQGRCSLCWCDSVKFIEDFLFKHKMPPNEVAAVLVEPIQGEGGYRLPVDDFFPKLRALCDEHGILLIADEIQSGMGRTGKWCAIEHWGVESDIVCLAKGLASGVPIGAIVAHKNVMQRWISGAHASTFGGNPVACAVASATIDIIREEGLLGKVTELGEYTVERLSAFRASHPSIRRVEGKGLMIGVEFATPEGQPFPAFRNRVEEECFLSGLITLGCGVSTLRIAPPLVITRSLLEEGLDVLEHAIATVEEEMWEPVAQK